MLDSFCEEKTLCTVRSYWREQFKAGNKADTSSEKPPTDQEHRPGDLADQAHRVQLTARSISFGWLIVDEINVRFRLLFLRITLFQSSIILSQHYIVVYAVDRIFQTTFVFSVRVILSFYISLIMARFSIQIFYF